MRERSYRLTASGGYERRLATPTSRRWLAAVAAVALTMTALTGRGVDAPHTMSCSDCHLAHDGFGNLYENPAGNANLCLSCHGPGAQGHRRALIAAEQAQPWPAYGLSTPGKGSSHRWDTQANGQVMAREGAPSGALLLEGEYAGRYARSYKVVITTAGSAGTARFDWWAEAPAPAGGTNLTTGRLVPIEVDDEGYVTYGYEPMELEAGLKLRFLNTRPAPAFRVGDAWEIQVRPGLTAPQSPEMRAASAGRTVACATCHDPHAQERQPFDPAAPGYEPGKGAGRHFMRVNNDRDEMCAECHESRFVTNSLAGSHPVGILPGSSSPTGLPTGKEDGKIWCSTCHQVHDSPSDDGNLLRRTDLNALCSECHRGMDTARPARHLQPLDGNVWPGGSYGSLYPADPDSRHRGSCASCHRVHGWPDAASSTNAYPQLLVEREENLCFTCHDGSPAGKNLRANFTKTYRHPVTVSGRHTAAEDGNPARYGANNRHAECADCHNVHALGADTVPVPAPGASASLKGVPRVSVTNLSTTTVTYTYRGPEDPTPIKEYEVCFVCHSSWTTQPAGQANYAAKFNAKGASFHPVEAPGRNQNINPNAFVNGWTAGSMMTCSDCHTSDDTTIRGPHGSSFQYILKKRAIASAARRTTSMTSDELCFDCHRFDTYANNSASTTVKNYSRFSGEEGHGYHVGSRRYSCYSCHETHGSATQAGLIVTGRSPGLNSYTRNATGGTCTATCHGSESYTVTYPR